MNDEESTDDLFAAMQQSREVAAAAYIGLTLEAAKTKAGNRLRVGSLDGVAHMLSADHVLGRVTVSVNDGVVVACRIE